MTNYNILELFRQQTNGTYGEECDRMERVIREIITENNSSKNAIHVLAFILMEIPSDFFYCKKSLLKSLHKFLLCKENTTKSLLRQECEKLERYRPDRVDFFLQSVA